MTRAERPTEAGANYQEIRPAGGVPIRAWTRGVHFEYAAQRQLANVARLPFVHSHVAAMPDVHLGIGATVGSVIPTIVIDETPGAYKPIYKVMRAQRDLVDIVHELHQVVCVKG